MSATQNLVVETYSDKHKSAWNEVIDDCAEGNLLFKRDYMEYHSDRFTDCSQVVLKGGKIVAVLPGNRVDDVVHTHQGLSYGGLIFKAKLRLKEVSEILELILEKFAAEGVLKLRWKLAPRIYRKRNTDIIEYLLFVMDAQRYRSDAYLVIDQEEGYAPNRNRKRAIKKAKSLGIEIQEGGDMDFFWESILSKNLRDRFGVSPVHTFQEMKYLMGLFPNEIQYYSAVQNGEVKAGAVIYEIGNIAHFQYSSGEEDRAENGALDLLFHDIIEKFPEKDFVSFGSSSEENGKKLNHGLVYWKESYGSIVIPQDFYEIDTTKSVNLKALRTE